DIYSCAYSRYKFPFPSFFHPHGEMKSLTVLFVCNKTAQYPGGLLYRLYSATVTKIPSPRSHAAYLCHILPFSDNHPYGISHCSKYSLQKATVYSRMEAGASAHL